MANRSKFQNKWLTWKDSNGTLISDWAREDADDPYKFICLLCNPSRSFSCDKGFERIEQHAKSKKHVNKLVKIEPGQMLIAAMPETTDKPSGSSKSEQNQIGNNKIVTIYNPREAAARAELLWTMEVIQSNSSINSCSNKKDLFQTIFPAGFPEGFSLSASKAQYLVTEALGPYFKNSLLLELKSNNVLFALLFDEMVNAKSKRELQIRVRFWSTEENRVVSRHLETFFIEKGDGETLFYYLRKGIESNDLTFDQVLTLGCDGPNVNKKVWRLFQDYLTEHNFKRIIDIGTCNIHIAHKGFLKGLDCLSVDVSDFIIKVYYYFHKKDLRCEEFNKIQKELKLSEHVFIIHSDTRWLTLGPSSDRMSEQLPALEEYFLRHIPKKESSTMIKQNYLDIVAYLRNPFLKSSLQFVASSAKVFTTEFTLLFQKEEPLIHILYSQIRKLILLLLSDIVNPELLNMIRFHDLESFLKNSSNFVKTSDVKCGLGVEGLIQKLSEKDQLILKLQFKEFYIASVTHIYKKIKDFTKLKYFQCLIPENIKKVESISFASKIAKLLPLQKPEIDVDQLSNEWKILQLDEEVRFCLLKEERIDDYWAQIFKLKTGSDLRYPIITYLVKNALSITHGNADVERGFSKSGQILNQGNTNMIERTLNAKLATLDGLKKYGSQIYKVPLTEDLLTRARHAHQSYLSYLEENKRIALEEKANQVKQAEHRAKEAAILKDIAKERKDIKKLETDLESAVKIYEEATKNAESIQQALKNTLNSNATLPAVKEIMSSLEKLRSKEKKQKQIVDDLRKRIEKRKSNMIASTVSRKKQKLSHT